MTLGNHDTAAHPEVVTTRVPAVPERT